MAAVMIYPSILGSTPPFCDMVRCFRIPESTPPSQNIPLLFNKCICATLQESTTSLPEHTAPFQQLYATLRQSTTPSQNIPPFLTNLYVRPSQNLPIPSRINPPFQPICMCDPPRITPPPPPRIYSPVQQLDATLPESTPLPGYTPLSTNVYVQIDSGRVA